MRRVVILPLLALALIVAGCSSGSTTKRTVTVVNTVTSGSGSQTTPKSGSVIVVSPSVSPSGTPTPTPTPTSPKTTPKPTTSKPTVAPIVKVDPLAADCAAILDSADIKKGLSFTIAGGAIRKKDVANPARGITGKIRCYYPKADANGTAPVVVALTQYASVAAAGKQVEVTVQAETDAGAVVSAATVNGYPAHVMLRAGGLIVVQYGTWTAAVAVADKLANSAVLRTGLPVVAGQVLSRVIKNG
ncbi:hypothetical protein ABIB25_002145 [Nakamurella sp. UYEF19]|uniref:hypothetical protein n=1 Tax=Nakamurella sp. UYEF19 TaxID=1756392 RepID=UPI003390A14A